MPYREVIPVDGQIGIDEYSQPPDYQLHGYIPHKSPGLLGNVFMGFAGISPEEQFLAENDMTYRQYNDRDVSPYGEIGTPRQDINDGLTNFDRSIQGGLAAGDLLTLPLTGSVGLARAAGRSAARGGIMRRPFLSLLDRANTLREVDGVLVQPRWRPAAENFFRTQPGQAFTDEFYRNIPRYDTPRYNGSGTVVRRSSWSPNDKPPTGQAPSGVTGYRTPRISDGRIRVEDLLAENEDASFIHMISGRKLSGGDYKISGIDDAFENVLGNELSFQTTGPNIPGNIARFGDVGVEIGSGDMLRSFPMDAYTKVKNGVRREGEEFYKYRVTHPVGLTYKGRPAEWVGYMENDIENLSDRSYGNLRHTVDGFADVPDSIYEGYWDLVGDVEESGLRPAGRYGVLSPAALRVASEFSNNKVENSFAKRYADDLEREIVNYHNNVQNNPRAEWDSNIEFFGQWQDDYFSRAGKEYIEEARKTRGISREDLEEIYFHDDISHTDAEIFNEVITAVTSRADKAVAEKWKRVISSASDNNEFDDIIAGNSRFFDKLSPSELFHILNDDKKDFHNKYRKMLVPEFSDTQKYVKNKEKVEDVRWASTHDEAIVRPEKLKSIVFTDLQSLAPAIRQGIHRDLPIRFAGRKGELGSPIRLTHDNLLALALYEQRRAPYQNPKRYYNLEKILHGGEKSLLDYVSRDWAGDLAKMSSEEKFRRFGPELLRSFANRELDPYELMKLDTGLE